MVDTSFLIELTPIIAIVFEEVRVFLGKKIEETLVDVAKPLILNNSKTPSVVLVVGVNGTGKTTTALHFAAKCQRMGKNVLYFNTEGRLELKNFEGIKGLDPSKIKVIEASDDRILSAEEYLNMIETYDLISELTGALFYLRSKNETKN